MKINPLEGDMNDQDYLLPAFLRVYQRADRPPPPKTAIAAVIFLTCVS